MTRNFTVCLDPVTVARVQALNKHFGGSVGGFARSLTEDFCWLEPEQISVVRSQIQHLVDANKKKAQGFRPRA